MKRRRLVLVAVAIVTLAALFALIGNRSQGPIYEGRFASDWFEQFRTASLAEREDALDAFKAMGDEAVPFLLSMLTKPHRLSRAYGRVWSKLPQVLRRFLPAVSTEDTESRSAYE